MMMQTFTGLTQYKPVFVDPPEIPEITLKDLRNKVKNKTKKEIDLPQEDGEDPHQDTNPLEDADEYTTVRAAITEADITALQGYVMHGVNAVCAHVLDALRLSPIDDAPRDALLAAADTLRQMALWIHLHAEAYEMVYPDVVSEMLPLARAFHAIANGIEAKGWDSPTTYEALQEIREILM
jgi:hypothetical protein